MAQFSEVFKTISPMLVPPGNGVYTISTGKTWRETLQKKLYGTVESETVNTLWQAKMQAGPTSGQTILLGMPFDNGAGIVRGANWGPLAIREKFYEMDIASSVFDLGDVRIIPHLLSDSLLNDDTIQSCRNALYGKPKYGKPNLVYPVSPLSMLEKIAHDLYAADANCKLVTLGGDHAMSYALVKSYLQANAARDKRVAVIHFDAHTDLLDSRLGIDITFGSWAAHILPYLRQSQDLIQLGIRATSHDKAYWQATKGVTQCWAQEIQTQGVSSVIDGIGEYCHQHNIAACYVSFDIDCLDIRTASACGTPEAGGVSLDEALQLLAGIKAIVPITAADLAEVAPFIHHPGIQQPEPETTLHAATEVLKALI